MRLYHESLLEVPSRSLLFVIPQRSGGICCSLAGPSIKGQLSFIPVISTEANGFTVCAT